MNQIKKHFSDYMKNNFNCKLNKFSILNLSNDKFNLIKKHRNLNLLDNNFGFFNPFTDISYINKNSPTNLFNYVRFGLFRQLFFNYSIQGNEFKDIILKKGDIENFLNTQYNFIDSLLPFTNKKRIKGFEILFTTNFLKQNNLENEVNCAYNNLSKQEKLIANDFNLFKDKYGIDLIYCEMGFSKKFNDEKILSILDNLDYKLNDAKYIMKIGSNKAYSDIDIFMISNNATHTQNLGWIDIHNVNIKDFYELYDKFDYSIVDGFFSGKLIYGNKDEVKNIKRDFFCMSITNEAIDYNFNKYLERKEDLQKNYTNNSNNLIQRIENMKNYFVNAKELEQGTKIFKYEFLKEKHKKYF
ncbi:MAG: hypothetical protein ACLFPJ_01940 [Candidatus Woesearchaeota archaeon]